MKPIRRAQRPLFAALLGILALTGLVLWGLRSGPARTASASARAPAASPAGETAAEAALPGPSAADGAEAERSAVPAPVSTGATDEADAADDGAFDPAVLIGSVRAKDGPVALVELLLFAGELDRRALRAPVARARSDEEGRFRFARLEPGARYTVHAEVEGFLPEDEAAYPGRTLVITLAPAASVGGRVLAAATRVPLVGVTVALERAHWDGERFQALVASTSDEQGRWQLPWAEPGMEEFLVLRPGFLTERREFQVEAEGGDGYELLLADEPAFELEVVDLAGGTPLADTELLLDDARVRTDARGRLAYARPARAPAVDESLRLALALPGGCVTQGRVALAGAPSVVRVPVTRGGRVHGRVLDADDAPVADAEVSFRGGGALELGLPTGFTLNPPRGNARSDAEGRFELVGLPPRPEPCELRARHPRHPRGQSEPFPFDQLGLTAEVDVRLARGVTIVGRVLVDGEPAPLRVFWRAERADGETRADERGDFRCTGIPAGEVTVGARLEGEEDDERPEDRTLVVEDGAEARCDLELEGYRARITGRVLDTLGAPVAGAEVRVEVDEEHSPDGLEFQGEGESGADGAFALAVPDLLGVSFRVHVASGPRTAELVDVVAGAQGLELVLPALGRLALRVEDADSRAPIAGYQLYWRAVEGGRWERLRQGGRRFSPGPAGDFVAELPAVRLDLAVSARSQGYVAALVRAIELAPGGRATPLTVRMEHGLELELAFRAAEPAWLDELRRSRPAIASDQQWHERPHGGAFFQEEVRDAQGVRLDELGRARLRPLAAGRYRFFNGPRGFEIVPGTFELSPVEAQRLEFEVRRKEDGARERRAVRGDSPAVPGAKGR